MRCRWQPRRSPCLFNSGTVLSYGVVCGSCLPLFAGSMDKVKCSLNNKTIRRMPFLLLKKSCASTWTIHFTSHGIKNINPSDFDTDLMYSFCISNVVAKPRSRLWIWSRNSVSVPYSQVQVFIFHSLQSNRQHSASCSCHVCQVECFYNRYIDVNVINHIFSRYIILARMFNRDKCALSRKHGNQREWPFSSKMNWQVPCDDETVRNSLKLAFSNGPFSKLHQEQL